MQPGYHWKPTQSQAAYGSTKSTSFSYSPLRKDAPIFEPRAATVAAGEDPSATATDAAANEVEPAEAAEENEVLQHPPSQLKEADGPERLTPEQNVAEPDPASSQEWAPSENEGEGSPRIQSSEVPNEYFAELQDFEDQEPEGAAENEDVLDGS